jgi:predicted amidohydrolase YtcJ
MDRGPDARGGYGRQLTPPDVLSELLTRAHANGLSAAVHAIGDAANRDAVEAFAATGARGTIEHAQLLRREDIPRMAALGVAASVQPAHLLDDRDITERLWAGRCDRAYAFRWLLDAGVELRFGSDAPVAPLDPWLAMAAAVHRSADERPPWHGEQALSVAEALRSSVDGIPAVAPGGPGDLVLLDEDPLAGAGSLPTGTLAARLRATPVAATVVAGRVVHG